MEKDVVYLVWSNPITGNEFKIGELYKKDNKFFFIYIKENVQKAKQEGFEAFIDFPNIDEVYENSQLFATFSSRLPDRRRPEIKEILEDYGMTEYDSFELLKRSGAKLPTDNFEFVK